MLWQRFLDTNTQTQINKRLFHSSLYLLSSIISRDSFSILFSAISTFRITPKFAKTLCARIQKLGLKFFRHPIRSQRLHKRSWAKKRESKVTNANYSSVNIEFNTRQPQICVWVWNPLSSQLFSQDNMFCSSPMIVFEVSTECALS